MKPMLAATLKEPEQLTGPLDQWWLSEKLDGVRAIVRNGVVLSRSLKPIPNQHVQRTFGNHNFEGFDGELIVGDPTAPDAYRQTMSGVMSVEGEPEVRFFAFDLMSNGPYHQRYQSLSRLVDHYSDEGLVLVRQHPILSLGSFWNLQENIVQEGYEGVMVRRYDAPYKNGRSTLLQGYLLKYKPFTDSEAMIIGFQEKMHNSNEATTNELGYTARSSHQANMVPMNTLGALICSGPEYSVTFNIGTGFDDALRQEIWDNREHYLNRLVKYKYLATGGKDRPRHPVFLGFRSPIDT